jgi:adenylosuccinate lyase
MPHKRNPEIAEHLGTLARVVRHNAALVAEGLVHDHERDGRSWKAEWNAIPLVTLATGKALALLAEVLAHLEVHAGRMRANLDATRGFVLSEAIMLALAAKVGKQSAHRLVYDASLAARHDGTEFKDAMLGAPLIMEHLSPADVEELLDYERCVGQCAAMVERVLASDPWE